jgi:hypothetical protein
VELELEAEAETETAETFVRLDRPDRHGRAPAPGRREEQFWDKVTPRITSPGRGPTRVSKLRGLPGRCGFFSFQTLPIRPSSRDECCLLRTSLLVSLHLHLRLRFDIRPAARRLPS